MWPPIADSVDTFLKRAAAGAAEYERTWRLIHIWEAISITLAGAGVARVRTMPEHETVFRRCREHLHGRTWDAVTRSFKPYQGALDGSALARLSILHELSAIGKTSSSFLTALSEFLLAEKIHGARLVQAWARICDVPDHMTKSGTMSVRTAMRLLNEFRNRLAHVPFPHDGIDGLAAAVEDVTEQLFSVEPPPWQGFKDERLENPMCGSLLWSDRVLHGASHRQNVGKVTGIQFFYPTGRKDFPKKEAWPAEPFIFIDSMAHPFVLTRLRSDSSGVWEFTRFRAEANAVVYHEAPEWQAGVAAPTESEYTTVDAQKEQAEEEAIVASAASSPEPDSSDRPPADQFEQALRFIRNEEYAPAIEFFRRLVASRPDYHIGWLRLGHAQRELAMRSRTADAAGAHVLFDAAIASLTAAANHSYPDRRAQALYERSKALFHRGRMRSAREDYSAALVDAEAAAALAEESAYPSWIEYLRAHSPQPPE